MTSALTRRSGGAEAPDGTTDAGAEDPPGTTDRPGASGWVRRATTPTGLALLLGLTYLPGAALGYGTDVDITNLLRSGESLLEGSYRYSRPPGALPYEALVGVLARLGGPPLVVLASTVAAVAVLVLLGRIVTEDHGPRAGRVAVLVLGTQPWFWVAASSLGDYAFALASLLLGVHLARRDHRVAAGLAFATGIGFRSGTVLLVGAWLLAELTTRPDPAGGDDPPARPWRAVLTTGVVAGLAGALWFIPSWLAAGRTNRFLLNEFETTGLLTTIGRWGIKNVAFFGLLTLAILLVRAPVLLAAVRLARTSALVRFAVLGALVAEALFLRFPWKPVHLLPTALALAVLLAASPRAGNRVVVLVVASQVLLGAVSITVARPDVADAATTGHLDVGITLGVVANDVACRLDPPYEGTWPDLDGPAADYAAIDVFTCQARSWRADPEPPAAP